MSIEELPTLYTAVPLVNEETVPLTTAATRNKRRSHNNGSFGITYIHAFHFIAGCLLGNANAIMGFNRLFGYFTGMSTTNILVYSVVWSLITSLTGYFLYNFSWTLLLWKAEDNHSLQNISKPHLLLQYEYSTYLGIFIGFCLGCTAADVVYGMPWNCVAATLVMAMAWAALMIWCARRESAFKEHAVDRHRDGTTLPFVVV